MGDCKIHINGIAYPVICKKIPKLQAQINERDALLDEVTSFFGDSPTTNIMLERGLLETLLQKIAKLMSEG